MQSGRKASYVAANMTNNKGSQVQLVIIDDPSNPRHPTPWYCIDRPGQRFWFYSPAILYNSPMKLSRGENMTLEYRVMMPAKPLKRMEIRQKAEGKN